MSWIGTSTGAQHARNTLRDLHQDAGVPRLAEEAGQTQESSRWAMIAAGHAAFVISPGICSGNGTHSSQLDAKTIQAMKHIVDWNFAKIQTFLVINSIA